MMTAMMMVEAENEPSLSEQAFVRSDNDAYDNNTEIRNSCLTKMRVTTAVPLALSLVALALTGEGSWDCHFIEQQQQQGSNNNSVGLWTLQDSTGQCQLRYDISYVEQGLADDLTLLRSARLFSMTSMLLGLAVTAALTQALQFHACSWGIGGALALLFLASVFMTIGIFNIWTLFFLLTYVMTILIVRFLFVHPVHHRGISARGCGLIAFSFALCSMSSFLTLIVLKSDNFCGVGNTCVLGTAGDLMVGAALLWAAASAAVLRYGMQPNTESETKVCYHQVALYPLDDSVRTHVVDTGNVGTKKMRIGTIPTNKTTATEPAEDGEIYAWESFSVSSATVCLGYRNSPRSRQEQCAYWSYRIMLGFLVAIYVAVVVLMIGTFLETTSAFKAPDTSFNFVMDQVCAFHPLDTSQPFETFNTKELALAAGFVVAHCGECGHCSNPVDIRTYVNTRKTVAVSAKKCGTKAVLGSYEGLVDCLEDRIGFSRDCTECWADNMINTAKRCLLTCMNAKLKGLATHNNVNGAGDKVWLNECLFCDEKQSGTDFVTCSGVARRRLGIQSEIERNPAEQCTKTVIDWVSANFTEIFPYVSFPDV